MEVTLGLRMMTQRAHPSRNRTIAGDDETGLAGRAEVLGGIEAETAAHAERADPTPVETRSYGLRCILNHRQPVARGKRHYAGQVSRLPIQMHGNYCLDGS